MDGEGGVPVLHAVGAVDEHAFGFDPEVVLEALDVAGDGGVGGAVLDEAGDCVHGGGDGGEVAEIRVGVFHLDELEGLGFAPGLDPVGAEEGEPDVDEDPVDEVEDPGLGVEIVHWCDRVAVALPVDRLERFSEHLLLQLADQRGLGVRPSLRVDVAGGQEDLAHVDPPAPWVDGHPVGHEPELGGNGVDEVPVRDAE